MGTNYGPVAGPASDLQSDLAGAFGLPAWGGSLGVGSSFALNFGEPRPGDPRRGQWRLRIWSAAWRIETPSAVLGASEYDREGMENAIEMLEGKVLVGADVETPSLSAVFLFSGDVKLRTFSLTQGRRHWILFRPDGMVRVAGLDDPWVLEPE